MEHRWIRALAVGLAASVLLTVCHFEAVCGEIRGNVLRLHILANSDSDEDQALKLRVRDAVLAESRGVMDGAVDIASATRAAQSNMPRWQAAAERCVAQNGYSYPVQVEWCEMYFTTRVYENGTLPAGIYPALRITIGEGRGHNWWCVIYPALCLPAAGGGALSDTLDAEACDVVQNAPRYEIRFKVVEWLEGIWKK